MIRKKMPFELELFRPGDELAVDVMVNAAYDWVEPTRVIRRLRAEGDMKVELLAKNPAGDTVGYIAFCRMLSPGDWFALSFLAVSPSYQHKGLGSDLVRYGLDYARRARAKAITVLGDGRYYQRFGFTYKAAQNLTTPYQNDKTLLYPIAAGTAFSDERLVYPAVFDELKVAPTAS